MAASPALDPDLEAFRMPAEWEEHEATWLGWPHNVTDWPGRFAPIPWVYGEIVRRLGTQMTQARKKARANFIIDNSGFIERTRKQVLEIIQTIKRSEKK